MKKNSILDQIDALTSGKVKPTPKDVEELSQSLLAKSRMKQRIKDVVGNKPRADPQLQKKAEVAQALVMEIQPLVAQVTIEDDSTYKMFDSYLARVRAARKEWAEDIEKIVKPLREAKEAVHEIDRKTDRPREALEKMTKGAMEDYQRRLLREKEEADRLKLKEANQQRLKAEELQRKASVAATPQMKSRLTTQAQMALEIAEAIKDLDTEPEVDASNSHVKRPMIWELSSMIDLVTAVAAGDVPLEVLEIDRKVINKYFREAQADVAEWPGIEVKQDVKVVSGGRWREE